MRPVRRPPKLNDFRSSADQNPMRSGWRVIDRGTAPASARRAPPTPQVANARRYAARVRILLALTGAGLLAVNPHLQPHPLIGAIGCAVLGMTGIFELLVRGDGWLGLEESLSCTAALCIVGFGEGRVGGLTLLWLSAAAVGVLARGGRVGGVARLLVTGALISPIVLQQRLDSEEVALLVNALALLLAVGRISRETSSLLRDPLTGALSRAALCAEIDRVAERAREDRPCALIMIDFDDFGIVNKRRGHAAGDAVLASAANAMQSTLGRGDFLGRLGGDEFAVLTFEADPHKAAQRIIDGARDGGAKACAGVARCPDDGRTARELLATADFALRMAKGGGKERVVGCPGVRAERTRAGTATDRLERLCAGEGLRVELAPVVELAGETVCAYEAVAGPDSGDSEERLRMLTLADSLGLREAYELACLTRSLSVAESIPPGLALNIPVPAAVLQCREASPLLFDSALPPGLTLEIGHERFNASEVDLLDVLASLRSRGVAFVLDGVGAGRADVSQLSVLRPEFVRLDPKLVGRLERDSSCVALLAAIADFAHRSGCRVIAAGIQTPEQLEAAGYAGADYGQGAAVEELTRSGGRGAIADDTRSLAGRTVLS